MPQQCGNKEHGKKHGIEVRVIVIVVVLFPLLVINNYIVDYVEKTARYGTRHGTRTRTHTHQSIIGHAINYEQQLQIILITSICTRKIGTKKEKTEKIINRI